MFSFLQRDLPAVGRVLFPGSMPPPLDRLPGLKAPVSWTLIATSPEQLWAIEATHPVWGKAEIACDRQPLPLPDEMIQHTLALSDAEKTRARIGQSSIAIRVHARYKQVLRDRKGLLFWLRTVMHPDGAVAIDGASTLLWSAEMLADELAHDADLDIESLYAIHAVHDDGDSASVRWLHTHGLEELDAVDVDVLVPSRLFVANCADPLRALAFAGLDRTITPGTDRFPLAHPGGDVRLVPVKQFHAEASTEHQRLRTLDEAHGGRRAVLCEPAGGLFGRWRTRPVPSRFLSTVDSDSIVVPFPSGATALMAERARQTLEVMRTLRAEFASLGLPAIVKLGYEVEGGTRDEREHLWFELHDITGDRIDATLANTPHRVPKLTAGQRGEHGLERLTDWMILSPEGSMTPRNIGAARRLRETRDMWQERIDAAKGAGPGS